MPYMKELKICSYDNHYKSSTCHMDSQRHVYRVQSPASEKVHPNIINGGSGLEDATLQHPSA